jgi:hypothetical protein
MKKIGLSYSRCVRDIVDGVVDIKDVLVVITRTDFDPNNDEQWAGIWEGYHFRNPEWADYDDADEDKFRAVSILLWSDGKLHQPRKFGAHPSRLPYYWLDTLPLTQDINANPATKKAWEQFQILSGLSQSKPTFNDDF